ncbi:MAG: hypothetical protein IKQ27_06465 [Lachnospiraceae bacterium]|nr:hypothetical protein [Lachnospiraceae bacterium]MBR6156584.1 hypothetical protein [Lachnospiraceae bacterium]MBR6849078.1 hypothetical protein [Lachnospiraceae bacterium]
MSETVTQMKKRIARTVLEALKDWFEVDVSSETVELAVMGVLNFGSNGFRHTDLTGRKE